MKALKPKGFKLIALSELPGTGGVQAKIYFNPDAKKVWILVIDPASNSELPFGPIAARCLSTLNNAIKDVMEMSGKPLMYIEED